MKKTLLLYWAPGGSVEQAAKAICTQIGCDKVELSDVVSFDVKLLNNFDNIILGGATIGADVWRDANDNNKWVEFFIRLKDFDLSTKKIAIFSLGNQILYPYNFVDGLGIMKTKIEDYGGKLLGYWPTDGYKFNESEGCEDGSFYGLVLDEDQQPELTSPRIKEWIELLNKEMQF